MSERLSPSFLARQPRLVTALYVRVMLAVFGSVVVLYGAYDLYSKIKFAAEFATIQTVPPSSATTSFRATAPRLMPARLVIPTIGVNAAVEVVGTNDSGAMATPQKFSDVTWYKLGAAPGEAGNAVFAGHVNNALTKAGVFEHLFDLTQGDRISIVETSGYTLTYAVVDVADYTEDDAPLATIFSKDGPSGLVLITCAGDWDPHARSYNKRLVIYTRLLSE